MFGYIEFFESVSSDVELFIIILLSLIVISNVVDFVFGWVNAKFNKKITFVSSVALFGIIKKMMYFVSLVLFGIIALIVIPHEISIPATLGLYIAYLFSEINSIGSHLGITEDGKKGELFIDFIKNVLGGKHKNG